MSLYQTMLLGAYLIAPSLIGMWVPSTYESRLLHATEVGVQLATDAVERESILYYAVLANHVRNYPAMQFHLYGTEMPLSAFQHMDPLAQLRAINETTELLHRLVELPTNPRYMLAESIRATTARLLEPRLLSFLTIIYGSAMALTNGPSPETTYYSVTTIRCVAAATIAGNITLPHHVQNNLKQRVLITSRIIAIMEALANRNIPVLSDMDINEAFTLQAMDHS